MTHATLQAMPVKLTPNGDGLAPVKVTPVAYFTQAASGVLRRWKAEARGCAGRREAPTRDGHLLNTFEGFSTLRPANSL